MGNSRDQADCDTVGTDTVTVCEANTNKPMQTKGTKIQDKIATLPGCPMQFPCLPEVIFHLPCLFPTPWWTCRLLVWSRAKQLPEIWGLRDYEPWKPAAKEEEERGRSGDTGQWDCSLHANFNLDSTPFHYCHELESTPHKLKEVNSWEYDAGNWCVNRVYNTWGVTGQVSFICLAILSSPSPGMKD